MCLPGGAMRISEETKLQAIRLIDEGGRIEPSNSEAFNAWLQASCEALDFDPIYQGRFFRYCCSSHDSISMRLYLGIWLLKQALHKVAPDKV